MSGEDVEPKAKPLTDEELVRARENRLLLLGSDCRECSARLLATVDALRAKVKELEAENRDLKVWRDLWFEKTNQKTDRIHVLILRAEKAEARVGTLEAKLAAMEDEGPYWLWRAMLTECEPLRCKQEAAGGDECQYTGGCITEWCTPCAARAFLASIRAREKGR